MKYYRLKHSWIDKEIGQFPQVSECTYDVNVNDPRFIDNLGFLEKLENDVKVPAGKLANRAKITDLVSASPKGLSGKLLISNRLKQIIKKYSDNKAQLFETYILSKGTKYVYWLLHPYCFDFEYIDFKRSLVKIENENLERVPIQINSFEEFQEKLEYAKIKRKLIFIDSISFKVNTSSDLFFIRYVYGGLGYYCSEKLKSEIEDSGCTGLIFETVESAQ